MKKSFGTITLLALVLGAASLFADAAALCDAPPELYPQTCIVTDVDRTEDVVTIETATGFVFAFYGAEDWVVGDLCACIMDNNGTPEDIRDDIIVTTRYSGTCEMFQ